ncbi:RNA polymerase sigma factor [Paenibacillus flagellatus]|nr:RNA polymerase sigma factor [Paenibacillus flagellatus]
MPDRSDPSIPSRFPHYDSLRRYCRMLAGTPWDGEDLLHDTVLKVLKAVPSERQRDQLPLSYWFRVATRTRIDACRKRRLAVEPYEDERMPATTGPATTAAIDIAEAIERLVYMLPPKQAAILLLVDAFRFTTRETAELLEHTSDGAVKTALRRARAKIADFAGRETAASDRRLPDAKRWIDRFTDAFRRDDPLAVVRAYRALTDAGIRVERRVVANRISFAFTDPEGYCILLSMNS